jgi:hypothetical protein
VKRRALESEDAVRKAEIGAAVVENARADLKTCQLFRQTADRWDKCSYNVSQLESAESQHRNAVSEAEAKFDRLKRAIADVESSCELEPEPGPVDGSSASENQCQTVRALLPKDPREIVGVYCESLMSATECQVCLARP